ncbi:MAG: class B sortase [Lachnospiraceae bacterium]|nr:class B sortase [Lachnospiraceae bacterium]
MRGISDQEQGKRILYDLMGVLERIIDGVVVCLILICVFFSLYSVYDSRQIYHQAEESHYQVAKGKKKVSRERLLAQYYHMNPDVFGWIQLKDTKINYPLVQGIDNERYVYTNARGQYSLAGALFLDCRNQRNLSDFNNIIFGHHMAENLMLGGLDEFMDDRYFESHSRGNLTLIQGVDSQGKLRTKKYGLKVMAIVLTDAYDMDVYRPGLMDTRERIRYLRNLKAKAVHDRKVPTGSSDHLMLLSTCSRDMTNGRYILVCKICRRSGTKELKGDIGSQKKGLLLIGRILGEVVIPLLIIVLWMLLLARQILQKRT